MDPTQEGEQPDRRDELTMARDLGTMTARIDVRTIVGYFEYGPGMRSMGRLLAFMVTVAGLFCVAGGFTMAVVDWIWNEAATVGSWIGLALAGLGSEFVGTAMKNWAKSVEAPVPTETEPTDTPSIPPQSTGTGEHVAGGTGG